MTRKGTKQGGIRAELLKKNNKELPGLAPSKVLSIIESLEGSNSRKIKRDQALVAFFYGVGGRACEIVKSPDKGAPVVKAERPVDATEVSFKMPGKEAPDMVTKKKNDVPYLLPIRKDDVEVYSDGYDVHNVRSLKRRDGLHPRTVPVIPTTQDELKIMGYFINYYNTIQNGEDPLFDITRQRAWQIINKRCGIFPHLLRHSAATQDSRIGFNSGQLRKKFGWADERTPGRYTHLNVDDLREKYRNSRRY